LYSNIKNVSIFTFINTIFSIATFGIVTAFLLFINIDKEKHLNEIKHRYKLLANTFLNDLQTSPSSQHLNYLYQKFKVKEITQFDKKLTIINNAKPIYTEDSEFGRIRVLKVYHKIYIYVQSFGYNILLLDIAPKPYSIFVAIILFSVMILLMFTLYILLKRKIKPLANLNKALDGFSHGEFDKKIEIVSDDEIGKISKSFNSANEYINSLINSKNLFMRNMMHELKTPLAKATILTEYIEDKNKKETMKKALNNMNILITQLANIEKLSSHKYQLKYEKVKLFTIVTNSSQNLFLDESNIEYIDKNMSLNVDITLFSTALQNLIDNAIKYSDDNIATIISNQDEIIVSSNSPKLTKELDYYTDAFSQEKKNDKGFGLGLYIVNTILNYHGFNLKYRYKDNRSEFIIKILSQKK